MWRSCLFLAQSSEFIRAGVAKDAVVRQLHLLIRLPAAAKRFVERHQIERALHLRLRALLLGLRQLTLGVQHVDKAGDPLPVTVAGQGKALCSASRVLSSPASRC
jgi:hypothetical protein